jgi:hypothetical protein
MIIIQIKNNTQKYTFMKSIKFLFLFLILLSTSNFEATAQGNDAIAMVNLSGNDFFTKEKSSDSLQQDDAFAMTNISNAITGIWTVGSVPVGNQTLTFTVKTN